MFLLNCRNCQLAKRQSMEQEIEKFPQAKGTTDVEMQDHNNVDLLFRHEEYHPL
jgi:hypothetical protein